jgi:hypothetical protein
LLAAFVFSLVISRNVHLGHRHRTAVSVACHPIFFLTLLILSNSSVPMANQIGNTVHHWAVITGPVDMIRHGGQLLYDVPSQYGFANVLIVAAAASAVGSSWDALWHTLTLLLVLQGLMLYAILGKLFGVFPLRWPIAACIVLLSMFVVPGLSNAVSLVGTSIVPANGPFRYIPVASLVFYVWVFSDRLSLRRFVLGGLVIWLLGCFWSVESLVWSSVIWLPTAMLRVCSGELGQVGLRRRALARAALVMVGHATVLAAALLVTGIVSLIVYRRTPDFVRYFDYVRHAPGQQVVSPARAATLVLIFAASVVLVGLLRLGRAGTWTPQLARAYAAGLAAWAVFSFYVLRPSPSFVTYLAFLLIPAVLAGLSCPVKTPIGAQRLSVIALTAAILGLPLAFGWEARARFLRATLAPQRSVGSMVPWYKPPAGPVIEELVRAHGESVVFAEERLPDESWPPDLQRVTPQTPPWLPMVPDQLVWFLPPDVRAIYIQRWVRRQPRVGWLVVPMRARGERPGLFPIRAEEIIATLAPTHRVTTDVVGQDYRLIRFEPLNSGGPLPLSRE